MNFLKFHIFLLVLIFSCNTEKTHYLNKHEEVGYIGMSKCASCHADIYSSFIKTGMGQSFNEASKRYSSSNFKHLLYDKKLNFYYHPYWKNDSLFVDEYTLLNQDTTHYLNYKVDYIIGSGHHTNSHLFDNNGYLYQIPFTYYTQDSILDFPPGFENNKNS